MINPQPTKTTLTWRVGQAIRRNRLWRAVADTWWRFQERNRITQRYPNATAILAWVLSFVVIMIVASIVYKLASDISK